MILGSYSMKRLSLLCLALYLPAWCARAQDDDPFATESGTTTGVAAALTSALEEAASLIAAEPALINESHEALYKAYTAAVVAADAASAAREKALCTAIVAALEKTKTGLDAAGAQSATAAIAAIKEGNASLLTPKTGDPATLAAVKSQQYARYQRLRASLGLAHADCIRKYVAALEKFQRSLAAASQLGDVVFVTNEIRGLRKLLDSGGTGGTPLNAFHFRSLPANGARTEVPAIHCGFSVLSALGGDFSTSESFLALRPPAPGSGADGRWGLRGGYVPEEATGGITVVEAPLFDISGAEITTREWRGGATAPPIKLIPAAEGFCMLGGLRGPFPTGAEARVSINATDNHWYLSGKGGTGETTVSAIIVRFANAADRPKLTPKAFTWTHQAPHVRMLEGANTFCAFTRLAGPIESRATALALALGPDGYWYLQGRADTAGTAAEATAFTFVPAS